MLDPVIQDRTRWWNREDLILILLLGALLFLPGLADVPLFERDEARFATAGRTMVETGDYIVPRFNGNLRPHKPPLIYWLQSGVYHVTRLFNPDAGFTELTARLPSAICSTLTLVVVYMAAGRRFGRVTGLLAAMMTASAVVFLVQSRLSTADATMVLFNTLAMACAWRAFEGGWGGPAGGVAFRRSIPKADSLDPAAVHAALDFGTLNPPREPSRLPLAVAMLFWIALALGTLAKGMPLIFIPLSLLTLSIATGRLSTEVRTHATDFFRRRNVLLAIALLPLLAIMYGIPQLAPQRGMLSAGWVLLCIGIAMPHLPSYILRYGGRLGNWSWWRQLRPAIGVPLFLALTLPWFIAAWVQTDGQLIQIMLGKHVVERTLTGLEGHGMPPGFYLATIWGGFWPWSILLIPAAFHVTRRLLGRTALHIDPRPYQFLVCWIVPAWLVYELAKTKLIHYPLPLYIPIAILCADTLVQSWLRLTDALAAPWFRSARWVMTAIWIGMAAAVVVGARLFVPDLFGPMLLVAGALIVAGIVSATSWGKPAWPFVVTLAWAAGMFMLSTLVLPRVGALRVSKTIGQAAAAIRADDPAYRVAAVGFIEDSLVFYVDAPVNKPGAENLEPPRLPGNPARQADRAKWIRDNVPLIAERLEFSRVPASGPSTQPAPDEPPGQKWILILPDDVRAEFDRQGIAYFGYDQALYNGHPIHATGINLAKGTPISISVITNTRPPKWPDRGPPSEGPPLEKFWEKPAPATTQSGG